jgi:hypothetical protein
MKLKLTIPKPKIVTKLITLEAKWYHTRYSVMMEEATIRNQFTAGEVMK